MTSSKDINIAILYPSDPVGDNIGGIESFVRGLLLAAPEHVHYTVFGATTDPIQRPLGTFTKCIYQGARFDYFPLYVLRSNQVRSFIPTTITYLWNFLLRRPKLDSFDVVECHRIEQLFLLRRFQGIVNLFLHNATAEVVSNKSSDMRWKWIPGIYDKLEAAAFQKLHNVLVVTEEGAEFYRKKYPTNASNIGHIDTIVNTGLFHDLNQDKKKLRASALKKSLNINDEQKLVIFVGRLDSSKNPHLLLKAFLGLASKSEFNFSLLFVGEGVLGPELKKIVADNSALEEKVKFLGFKSPEEVATLMQCCNLFALSSAYEGMPISALEALSCGVPVISTDVGAVKKVVVNGLTGEVAPDKTLKSYENTLEHITTNLDEYTANNCVDMARPYAPKTVFSAVFERYETLLRMKKDSS